MTFDQASDVKTPRRSVVPLAVLRLVYYFRATDSSDYAWELFNFGTFSGLQPFVSIMLASMPFAKPILDSLILQPYLIAVEEPQSIIPGSSKGTSWAQRIQDSRASRSKKLPLGLRPHGSRTDALTHWPYSQTQDEDRVALANEQGLDLGNYTTVSGARFIAEGQGGSRSDLQEGSFASADGMVITETRTATVNTT